MSHPKKQLYYAVTPTEMYSAPASWQQRIEELTRELNHTREHLQQQTEELKKTRQALQESQTHLHTTLTSAPIILWALDTDGIVTLSEGRGLEKLGLKPGQLIGQSVFDLYSHQPIILENIALVFCGIERNWTTKLGEFVYESWATPQRGKNNEIIGLLGVSTELAPYPLTEDALQKANEELELRVAERTAALKESNDQLVVEIVEHVLAERELRYRVEFEQLIATLSTHFINLASEEIDSGINRALEVIGTFSGVDRSYVMLLDDSNTQLNNTHEWCAAGISPQIEDRQNIPLEALYWWQEKINQREIIYIPSVANLSRAERITKTILCSHAIQALIVVPMVDRGSLIGFLGFDAVRSEKTWSDDIIALLRIVGEMFVNALERKRVEEALTESEKKYRNLVETSQDLIWSVDSEGRFTFINAAAKRIYGYEPAEMIGRDFLELLPPEQAGKELSQFEKILQQKNAETIAVNSPYETIHLRRDGTPVYLRVSSLIHRSETGGILGITGTATDITERKRSEAALQQAKDQLQAVFDAVPGFISWVSADLRYIGVNQHLSASFNLPPEAFVGQEIGFLETGSGFANFIRDFFSRPVQQDSQEFEIEVNGSVRNYLIVAQKYHQAEAAVSVGIDISARKRAEAQKTQLIASLQESERKFRSLYEATSDAVMLLDEQGYFDCNRATLEMFGCPTKAQFIGKHPSQFSPSFQPNGQDSISLANERIVTASQIGSHRFDWLYRRHDGSEFPAEVLLTAMELDGKQVLQAVVRDITERKRNEEEIKASLAEKEVLLKEIHHRVKNNLQVISSLLRLQSRYIHDQQTLEMLKESQNRVRSMALVHEQLYQSQDLSQINVSEYIQNLTSNLFSAYEVNAQGVKLQTDIAPISVNIDLAVPCGLMINELVSNSLKYAFLSQKGGEINITFKLGENQECILVVSDNGSGLPATFNFQNPCTLGLRLVTSLVKQLRGSIELEQTCGTAFKITFSQPNSQQGSQQNAKEKNTSC